MSNIHERRTALQSVYRAILKKCITLAQTHDILNNYENYLETPEEQSGTAPQTH